MTRPFVSEPLIVAPVNREPAPPPPEYPQSTVSAVALFNVLLRYRVMILILTLLSGFWAGFKSVTSGKSYTTEAAFIPKGARGQSQLGNIAAQFGVNINSGDVTQSSQFYIDLLETKGLLWPVAQKKYRIVTDSGVIEGDLMKIYNIKPDRPVVMKVKTIEALEHAIKGTVSAKTGVITVTVATGNPQLSLQVAQNVLNQVNIYNLNNRQRQAAA